MGDLSLGHLAWLPNSESRFRDDKFFIVGQLKNDAQSPATRLYYTLNRASCSFITIEIK